ncbi:MAG: DUF2953 domain-containing protein [Spirochaetaceae bacterium]
MPAVALLLIILAAAGAVALIALAAPFAFRFRLELPESGWEVRVTWLWDAVSVYRSTPGKRRRKADRDKGRRDKRRRGSDKKRRRRVKNPKAFLRKDFRRVLLSLSARLLRRVDVRTLRLRVVFGLYDPADTGMAYGWILPVALAVGRLSSARIVVEPRFDNEDPEIEIDGEGHIRVVPILLAATLLGLFFRRDGWIVLGTVREALWSTAKPSRRRR